MDREDEVFLDAVEEVTPRRSGRKRRSTAGSVSTPAVNKRARASKVMPTERSPKKATQATESGTGTGTDPQGRPQGTEGTAEQAAKPPDQFMDQMQAMLKGMEGRLSQATANLQTTVTGQLGELQERVKKNEERMDRIHSEVGELVETRIEEGLRKFMDLPAGSKHFPPLGGSSSDPSASSSLLYASALSRITVEETSSAGGSREGGRCPGNGKLPDVPGNRMETDYWTCRRSLRLRPVEGDGKEAAKKYMRDYLKLEEAVLDRLGHFTATRVAFGPKTRHQKEMLVCFDSMEARDVVRGAATNLGGHGPDVGIRLEIPRHLRGAMRALQSLSYEIRTRHAGSRRNILFDDEAMDLVLDFSVGDGPWRRVSSEQARAKNRGGSGSSRLRVGDSDEILDKGRLSGEEEEMGRGPSKRNRMGFGGDCGDT